MKFVFDRYESPCNTLVLCSVVKKWSLDKGFDSGDYVYPSSDRKSVSEESGEDCVRKATLSIHVFSNLPQFNTSIVF